MSAEANKALAARFFETYAKGHDVEAAGRLFADGAVITENSDPVAMDVEGYKGQGSTFLASFADLDAEMLDQFAEGDQVVTRVAWSGTHSGDFNGIPATGKQFRAEAVLIDRVAAGKIVARHTVADYLTMMMQLGVIPAPGQGD